MDLLSYTHNGKKLPLLLMSDVHFDSLKCDRESLTAHLDAIKEKNGKVIIVGDWFDVMGCYRDPRSKAADVDSRYIRKGRSYLDLVVEDSFEFLKPYVDNLLLMSYGNHETSILKHRDTDPLDRLIFLLNREGKVLKGDYSGYIRLVLKWHNSRSSFYIKYHHGKGGNAKRSKGILYSQIDAMQYPDANLIISGHDHNKIYDPSNVRERVDIKSGRIYHDTIHWLKLGSYKKSSMDNGWEVEKGFLPKRMGGWFLDLDLIRDRSNGGDHLYIQPTFTEALPIYKG